jgi:hypothetical protein
LTTSRKSKSNRRNARRSTGPRTSEGKRAASRNALRHGLAVPGVHQSDKVKELAEAIAGGDASPSLKQLAQVAAEATLDLRRVNDVYVSQVNIASNAMQDGLASTSDARAGEKIADLANELLKLDRYQRRANSRQRTALKRVDAMR